MIYTIICLWSRIKKNVLSASEKNMQLKFVSYLMNGIKTVKKGSAAGTSGRMLTDERIPLPEGIVAPTYLYDGPLNHSMILKKLWDLKILFLLLSL